MECIAAFDSYSASGYVIRCNQREKRTSRSHQHLHIALLLELEQIRCAVLIHHVSVCAQACWHHFFGHKRRRDRRVVGELFEFNWTRWAGAFLVFLAYIGAFTLVGARVCLLLTTGCLVMSTSSLML